MMQSIKQIPAFVAALLIATFTLSGEILHLKLQRTQGTSGSETNGARKIALVKLAHTCLLCEHVVTEPATSLRDQCGTTSQVDFVAAEKSDEPFDDAPGYSGNRDPPSFF